eukprot:scaffold3126_cov136-Amphora_coffeaeformis.AAC.7
MYACMLVYVSIVVGKGRAFLPPWPGSRQRPTNKRRGTRFPLPSPPSSTRKNFVRARASSRVFFGYRVLVWPSLTDGVHYENDCTERVNRVELTTIPTPTTVTFVDLFV